ncbi:uncharacterized protein [Diabrotica undecimpunctata]|uniref:uncharacterized protein isoform X1 n=1 Tax=Diabrotica undecimpunctata TaxID=50387 RepID=UPI003B634AEF
MNWIHSSLLALVMSIFLIQASDPPYEKPTGRFIKFYPLKTPALIFTPFVTNIQKTEDDTKKISDRQFLSTDLQPPTLDPQELQPPTVDPQNLLPPPVNTFTEISQNDFLPPVAIYSTLQDFPTTGSQNTTNISEAPAQNNLDNNLNLPLYPPIHPAPFDTPNEESPSNYTQEQSYNTNDATQPSFSGHPGIAANANNEGLTRLHNYLRQINNESQSNTNEGFHNKGKSSYDTLLEQDFIRPLLKLYEKEIHLDENYAIANASRISKEDYLESVKPDKSTEKVVSEDTINNRETAVIQLKEQDNKLSVPNEVKFEQQEVTLPQKEEKMVKMVNDIFTKPIRRDDFNVVENRDKEHIGEILPSDFYRKISNNNRIFQNRRLSHIPFKSNLVTPVERSEILRIPVVFPSGPSSEGIDGIVTDNANRVNEQYYARTPRLSLPLVEHFRVPRRYKGFRDNYSEGPIYFDPSARYQTAWTASSRRPRVIFPTEQVAFRDPVQNQEAEPDWLAGDSNLQDLQEQDIRDRGSEVFCAPGATCEFFLSCWLSGGLLDQPCGGLLKGCCYRGRVAKTGPSGLLAIGTLDAPVETPKVQQFAVADNDNRCGVSSPQAQRRIVGGEEAGFGTFPWQAYIRIGSSRCGGSLVSRRHVVTAGHCVARATPRQVHVTLGDYVINSAVEPLPAYTFGVSTIQVHPFFKFTPQADRFDVAVLRLDRAAHNLPHITPICLPPRGENFLGEIGVAAGWGALSPGSRLRPQTLQAVQVPVIENKQCERWHRSKGISVTIYEEMMCAGYKNGGRDSCQGDSGGPLMLQRTGRWFLIGIVSAGYSCAQPGQPGIYHRVAHTVDWITRAIGS